jgi:hypothetical protein
MSTATYKRPTVEKLQHELNEIKTWKNKEPKAHKQAFPNVIQKLDLG